MDNRLADPSPAGNELTERKERIRRRLLHSTTVSLAFLASLIILALVALGAAWQARRSAGLAQRALIETEEQKSRAESALAGSRLAQARALRAGGVAGWRFQSLAALQEAARIQPSQDLRNEYAAALLRPDFGPDRFINFSPTNGNWMGLGFDAGVRRVAQGFRDGAVTILDIASGETLQTLPGFGERALNLNFSEDGAWLVTGYDNRVIVWDIATARRLFEFDTPVFHDRLRVTDLCRDRTKLLVWDENRGLFLFNLGQPPAVRQRLITERLEAFALHPEGSSVAIIAGNICELRDTETLETRRQWHLPGTNATLCAVWSPRGRLLAGCGGNRVWVLDTETGRSLNLEDSGDYMREVLFSADEQTLMAHGWGEGRTRVWDAWTGRLLFSTFNGYVRKISSDGARVGFFRNGHSFGVWDWAQPAGFRRLLAELAPSANVVGLTFDEGSRLIAVRKPGGAIQLFDFPDGTPRGTLQTGEGSRVLFRPGTEQMAVGGNGYAELLELRRGADGRFAFTTVRTVRPADSAGELDPACFSPDGRWLLLMKPNHQGWLLDIEGDQELKPIPETGGITSMSFSRDGEYFAVGLWNTPGALAWQTRTMQPVFRSAIWRARVKFLPDSDDLLVSHPSGYELIEVPSGKARSLHRRTDAPDDPGDVSASGNGQRVAIASGVRQVAILERATWKEWLQLPTGTPSLRGLTMDEEGNHVLGRSADAVYHWDLSVLERELIAAGLGWNDVRERDRKQTPATLATGGFRAAGSWILLAVFAGMLTAAWCALLAFRHQRNLLVDYEDVEELVTERGRALTRAQAEVVHAQKMKALGTLAAGIAHDFNNLLSVIRMANQLTAEKTRSDSDVAENTVLIEASVEQGKAVVGSMLGYTREPGDRVRFAVNEVVQDTVKLLTRQFLQGIKLTLDLDPALPLVSGTPSRLKQMLLNLIVNAVEAMNGSGELRVGVSLVRALPEIVALRPSPADAYVQIEVADSGPGMTPAIRDLVFEPFFTTKHRTNLPGTGLGLSMVHNLAVQEGFGLALHSTPGTRTTFCIYVPPASIA